MTPVLVSSTVSAVLLHACRATTLKSVVKGRRAHSTHIGAPQSHLTEQLDASRNASTSESTSPPTAVPASSGLGTSPRYMNRLQSTTRPTKVSTLDKGRLTSHDFLALSDRTMARTQVYRSSAPDKQTQGAHQFQAFLSATGMPGGRFPQHARGFLYYHLSPNAPALSGQVRFRVTGTNDPALFSSGEDLLRSDYLPWRIPVLSLPPRKYYTALLRRLLDDGLVSEHVLRIASSLPPNSQQINGSSARMIHALGQLFLLRFGQTSQPFYFIGADTILPMQFMSVAMKKDNANCGPAFRGASHTHCDRGAATDRSDVLQGLRSAASRSLHAPSTQGAVRWSAAPSAS